eukprot:TRINITY_DN10052_c0_g1_i2.p1 TRINITY_DN10052_c0_g1~~TRINITY_DN10052_c0_g1_i2.p1  ORF type:complete len:751 (+),score=237.34 TRINITY_DN10052_c0_g1_i2:109-2361(+)
MALQLLHWCFTRRGETEAQREEREFSAQLQDESPFLNEEANQIFSNMKLCPEKGKVALLHHYKIGDEAMLDLFKHFDRNTICLQLNLSHNIISDEGAGFCAHALRRNSTLLELNLSYNKIGDEGIERIGDALKKNTCLTELQICENDFEDRGAAQIAEALKTNMSLTCLCLGDSRIGDETAATLGKALETNNTLTRLDLFNCRVGDQGAAGLAAGLRHRVQAEDEHMEDLNLGKNFITDEGCADLLRYVGESQKIKVLQLYRNLLTDASLSEMTRELEKNTSLTQLNIGGNKMTKATIRKFNDALRGYQKRDKNPSKLMYVNTYQCIDWGDLDPEAQEAYDQWLAVQKAAAEAEKLGKKIEVDVLCDSCKGKMSKMPRTPWPEWICNGCDKGGLGTRDVCYACAKVEACDFAYCAACYERTASLLRQQQIQEQLAGKGAADVDVLCPVCANKLEEADPHPWPAWICNICEKPDLTSKDPLYACGTCNDCDYGLCRLCFTKQQTRLRLEQMSAGDGKAAEAASEAGKDDFKCGATMRSACGVCNQVLYRKDSAPWDTWKCSLCAEDFVKDNPIWSCKTVSECKFGFCDKCAAAEAQKIRDNKVPCMHCHGYMSRMEGLNADWGCDGCGAGPLGQDVPCYSCDQPDTCDYMYCEDCFRCASHIGTEREFIVPIGCGECSNPVVYQEKSPWPRWTCTNCERKTLTADDELYGCESVRRCEFCLCRTCFLKICLYAYVEHQEKSGGQGGEAGSG